MINFKTGRREVSNFLQSIRVFHLFFNTKMNVVIDAHLSFNLLQMNLVTYSNFYRYNYYFSYNTYSYLSYHIKLCKYIFPPFPLH